MRSRRTGDSRHRAGRAGDMSIDVGRDEDDSHVDASLWAGDIHAVQRRQGRAVPIVRLERQGSYRLHAKLKAGDLRLYSKGGI